MACIWILVAVVDAMSFTLAGGGPEVWRESDAAFDAIG
jgi:hypothetical protein